MSYTHLENSWLEKDNVAGLADLVELFYKIYPKKPNGKSKPNK